MAQVNMGYKLMLLAALRMICDKSAQALYLFSASNQGTQRKHTRTPVLLVARHV